MTDAIAAGSLVIIARECPEKDTAVDKVQHLEERSPKHKDSLHLYGDEPDKEDEEEEVMTTMCHSCKIYSVIQKKIYWMMHTTSR